MNIFSVTQIILTIESRDARTRKNENLTPVIIDKIKSSLSLFLFLIIKIWHLFSTLCHVLQTPQGVKKR